MNNIKATINEVLREIQNQNDYELVTLSEEKVIVEDLGFTSLDVAQLVASLEMELDLDPFAEDMSILDIHTIGGLYVVYEKSLQRREKSLQRRVKSLQRRVKSSTPGKESSTPGE